MIDVTTSAGPVRPPETKPTRVLYIGGVGRSGSSVLARLLDELPGATSIGEVVRLWERGIQANERCSCGERFANCPFWSNVGQAAFGGWQHLDVEAVLDLKRRVGRLRHLPLLLGPRSETTTARRVRAYASCYARLYAGIQQLCGCDVVVDSSKNVSLAAVLRWSGEVDLRIVHLVRDVRGVAHSWGKRIPRPETDGATLMPAYSPWTVGVWWTVENALFHLLAARGVPTLCLRYEYFVAHPSDALDSVLRFAGLPDDSATRLPLDGRKLRLTRGHTMGGNPMRFASTPLALHSDDTWRDQLEPGGRRIVSALGLPLRIAYGYTDKAEP